MNIPFKPRHSIVGVGNALLDILAPVQQSHLDGTTLTFGEMTLISSGEAERLLSNLLPEMRSAGGSAANSTAIAGILGASAGFVGVVGNDANGAHFAADMEKIGVQPFLGSIEGHSTGTCLSLIAECGQRTMGTSLSAAQHLGPDHLDENVLNEADTIFIEGYLLDTKPGFDLVTKIFNTHQGKIALTLSDPGCVRRNRGEIRRLLPRIDVLFGNDEEFMELMNVTDLNQCMDALLLFEDIKIVLTNGAVGIWTVENRSVNLAKAKPAEVKDTTGAGDSVAGTILWALSQGHDLKTAAEMATHVAALVISQIGARPSVDLAAHLSQAMRKEPA